MNKKRKKAADVEALQLNILPRYLAVPVLVLALVTVPWFFGGREPIGLLVNSLLSGLLFVAWLVVSRHQALKVSTYPRAILWSLVALMVWSMVTLPLSISRYESLLYMIPLLQSIVVFVVARDLVGYAVARKFIWVLWTLVALSVLAIGSVIFVIGDYERMTSLFYWANPLATYLIVAILAALLLMQESEVSTKARRFWLIAAGLLAGGLILTYSRAGWLIGIVAVVTYFLSQQRRPDVQAKDLISALLRIVTIAVVASAVLVTLRVVFFKSAALNVSQRVAESTTSTSVTDRFAYWRESTAIFAARPLTGWGIGTFKEIHPMYQESPTTAGDNPHSTFFQAFAELGVVGAALYLTFIAALVRYAWQMLRDDEVEAWRQVALLAVLAIGAHSLVDLVSNYPVLILTTALFLAMALPITEHVHEMRVKSWRLGIPLVAFSILLAAALWYSYHNYLSAIDADYTAAISGVDPDEAADNYAGIFERPVYDPTLLADAALLQVSRYATRDSAPVSLLDDGESYARLALRREPYNEKAHFALAQILENQGKTTEALKEYKQTITIDPHDYPPYQIAYAKLLRREGYVDDAIQVLLPVEREYTDAVIANRSPFQVKPQVASAQVLLTDLYIQRGQAANAERALKRVGELVPQDDPVLALLRDKLATLKK